MTAAFSRLPLRGGAGLALNAYRSAATDGPPVLFVHGFSQSGLAWRHQLASQTLADCQQVALDLRGHGHSDKPFAAEAYTDGALMADDVAAALATFEGRPAVLVGWSYGGLVVADYLQAYGTEAVAGVVLCGAVTRIGDEAAMGRLGPGLLRHVPGLFATEMGPAVDTLAAFIADCEATPSSDTEALLTLGYNVLVPPSVRAALFSRAANHDALLASVDVPTLVCHGTADTIVLPAAGQAQAERTPGAQWQPFDGAGHCPFSEQPEAFNQRLRKFVAHCASHEAARVA